MPTRFVLSLLVGRLRIQLGTFLTKDYEKFTIAPSEEIRLINTGTVLCLMLSSLTPIFDQVRKGKPTYGALNNQSDKNENTLVPISMITNKGFQHLDVIPFITVPQERYVQF